LPLCRLCVGATALSCDQTNLDIAKLATIVIAPAAAVGLRDGKSEKQVHAKDKYCRDKPCLLELISRIRHRVSRAS
jgi:hypothetical protein